MSREVRMVPPDWQHPTNERGFHKPLFEFSELEARAEYSEEDQVSPDDCMPDFGDKATHMRMYENTTEGTPISPAFATAEELARWLVDNKITVFANMTATYDEWLQVISSGAHGMVITVKPDGTTKTEAAIG